MLNYPAIFFLIGMGAAAIGFSGVATNSAETAQALSVIFLIGSICSLPTRWRSRD